MMDYSHPFFDTDPFLRTWSPEDRDWQDHSDPPEPEDVPCTVCDGRGRWQDEDSGTLHWWTCSECEGTGHVPGEAARGAA